MMIENDILTIIYHEGKGRFTINLSLFLPCSNTDLKRIINMIDESPDRDETARELSDYIAAKQAETEAEAANEWRDNAKKKLKAAAGKYAALSAIMSKHYGTQATEAPEKITLKKTTVYGHICENGRNIIKAFPGHKFFKGGLWFSVYRRLYGRRGEYIIILSCCGIQCATAYRRDDITDAITPDLLGLIKKQKKQIEIAIKDFWKYAETSENLYIPEGLEELQPVTITAEEATKETAKTEAAADGTPETEAPHDVKTPEMTAQAPEAAKRTESTEAAETSTETTENATETLGAPQADNTTPETEAPETAETSATEENSETPTEHTETETATEAPKTPTETQQATETGETTLNTATPTERAKTTHRDETPPETVTAPRVDHREGPARRATGPGDSRRDPQRDHRWPRSPRGSPQGKRPTTTGKILRGGISAAVSGLRFLWQNGFTLAKMTLAKMEG